MNSGGRVNNIIGRNMGENGKSESERKNEILNFRFLFKKNNFVVVAIVVVVVVYYMLKTSKNMRSRYKS